MKRPVLCWVILFVLGEVTIRYGSVWCIGAVAAGLLIVITFGKNSYICSNKRWLYIGMLFFSLGAAAYGYEQYKQQICTVEDGTLLSFCGRITDVEVRTKGTRYQVAVSRLGQIGIRCRIWIECEDEYSIGCYLEGTGTVRNFETASNPGGFDERNYQLGKGNIFSLQQVRIHTMDSRRYSVKAALYTVRDHIAQIYARLFSEADASLAGAMVLGDRTNLDADVKQLYQRNGIAHLIAISGLHIAMLGGTLYQMLRKWSGSYLVAAGIGIVFILLYGMMAGLTGATLRAVVMLIISIGADITGRKYDSLTAIATAMLLMLLYQPNQLNQAGFLLSFGAVIGIAVVQPAFRMWFPNLPKVLDGMLVSISVQLVLLPIMLYFFYEVPVYSVLLNLIVVPLMSILLFFLIVTAVLGSVSLAFGVVTAFPAKGIFACYQFLCRCCEQIPGHTICTGRPGVMWIVGYYLLLAVVIWMGYRQRYRMQMMFLCFLLSLFGLFYLPGPLRICMFDVGQGDGIFLKMPSGENILIDGGSSSVKKVGSYVLKNGIKYYGGARLDYVFVSHSDSDHYSGIAELLEEPTVTIRYLVMPNITNPDEAYQQLVAKAKQKGSVICYMKTGDQVKIGEVSFLCMNPEKRGYEDKNQGSMVLYIQYRKFTALFTGDMDAEIEAKLLPELPEQITVLKVAHHGSATASSEEFLQRISFQTALVSVGAKNRYGHPAREVMERLRKYCKQIYLTKDVGGITIDSDGRQYRIRTVR